MKDKAKGLLEKYCGPGGRAEPYKKEILVASEILLDCFSHGGKLLICGNGGSNADSDHIVGEFVKAFRIRRPLDEKTVRGLMECGPEGEMLAKKLEGSLPAINLGAQTALMTAILNDLGGDYIYAQQVLGYGKAGDILIGISTSGNSPNILNAGVVAKAVGMKTIGLTGKSGGKMAFGFDVVFHADSGCTEDIQDIHSVIYHALCAIVEAEIWSE